MKQLFSGIEQLAAQTVILEERETNDMSPTTTCVFCWRQFPYLGCSNRGTQTETRKGVKKGRSEIREAEAAESCRQSSQKEVVIQKKSFKSLCGPL